MLESEEAMLTIQRLSRKYLVRIIIAILHVRDGDLIEKCRVRRVVFV